MSPPFRPSEGGDVNAARSDDDREDQMLLLLRSEVESEEESVKLCEEMCGVEGGGRQWREGEGGGCRRWMEERGWL